MGPTLQLQQNWFNKLVVDWKSTNVWLDPQRKLDLDIFNELEKLFRKLEETAERQHDHNIDIEIKGRKSVDDFNYFTHNKDNLSQMAI